MTEPDENLVINYDLQYPLVVLKSNGGTLDDKAFCAGFEYARVDEALHLCRHLGIVEYGCYIRGMMKVQVDLLCMHLGWNVEYFDHEDEEEDSVCEWVFAAFEAKEITDA